MRTFHITIRQPGRVTRFCALARSSCEALGNVLRALPEGDSFSVFVRGRS